MNEVPNISLNVHNRKKTQGKHGKNKEKQYMATARPLERTEINAMLAEFKGLYRDRNKALFLLGLTTGFRISELLSLTISDIVDESGAIVEALTVSRGRMKGKKRSRSVWLSEQVRAVIDDWCNQLRKLGFRAGNEYAFCQANGEPISYYEYWDIVKRTARRAGLSPIRGVSTHSMRKTFARNVWRDAKRRERGGEHIDAWKVVQEALGHKSIESTQHYMNFLDRNEIKSSVIAAQEAVLCHSE